MSSYYLGFTFICRCLAPYYDDKDLADIRCRLTENDFPFRWVIDIANDYFVTTGIWTGLKSKGLDQLLDDEYYQFLHSLHALNRKRNIQLRAQLIEAVRALNSAGIKPLLFKGSGQLLQPVHKDIGERMMSDLDILIPLEQIPDAMNALKDKGYREADTDYDTRKFHHCTPLVRADDYGPIELHRRAFQDEISHVLPTKNIWEDARSQTLDGIHFYLPSPTHSILICMIHSQEFKSSFDPRMFNLRALQDIAAMNRKYRNEIDWSMISRIMKSHGFTYLADLLLLSAHRLMGMPLPKNMMPGPSSRLLYMASLGAMNRSIVDRLTRDAIKFSAHLICLRYTCSRRWIALSAYRMRYVFSLLKSGLGN